jgi:hypothetical protein
MAGPINIYLHLGPVSTMVSILESADWATL